MKQYERMMKIIKDRRQHYEEGIKLLDEALAIHNNEELSQEEKEHTIMISLMKIALFLDSNTVAMKKELDDDDDE